MLNIKVDDVIIILLAVFAYWFSAPLKLNMSVIFFDILKELS